MNRHQFTTLVLLLASSFLDGLWAEDKPSPPPSGPQTDGLFRKVILDADRDIDGDGKISHIFPKVKVDEHYDEVLEALAG